MSPSSPASTSAAADTPRRMTRALAKSLGGTDSPGAPSPSSHKSPSAPLRQKVPTAATGPTVASSQAAVRESGSSSGTIGGSSDDGIVVVEQPGSPEVIVLGDSSDVEEQDEDGHDEDVQEVASPVAAAAEPVEAELAAASQAVPAAAYDDEEEDEDEDDESSSSDDDGSSSDSDDVEDESAGPAFDDDALEALLSEAYLVADAQTASKVAAETDGEVVLQLDQQKDKPLPSLSVPDLPEAYFSIHSDGRVTRGPAAPSARPVGESANAVASSSKLATSAPTAAAALELDTFALPAQLSKKAQKAARKANAPLGWAELPPIPDDRRKDMTREYHALRLRNALDPKRHYKGQGSSKTVPEVFAIGKLHEPSKVLSSSTLTPAAAARPGSIVSDILADTNSRAYAKRKFGALQSQRERNGRKKTTKKPRH